MLTGPDQLAALLDATLLRADACRADIQAMTRQALADGCAAVCVAPAHVATASAILAGTHTAIAATVSFPLGATTTSTKSFEALEALRLGAGELDIVCDLDSVRRGDVGALEREMGTLMERTPEAVHKFILEVGWLPQAAWKKLGRALCRLKPAFVKTGTGVNAGAVTVEQVERLREVTGGQVPVKAAGGIRTKEFAVALVAAGAGRLGTSSPAELLAQWEDR